MQLEAIRDFNSITIFKEAGFTGKLISTFYIRPYNELDFTRQASLSFPLSSKYRYHDSMSSYYLSHRDMLLEPSSNKFQVLKFEPAQSDITLSIELPEDWWNKNIDRSLKLTRNSRMSSTVSRLVDEPDSTKIDRLISEIEIVRRLIEMKQYLKNHSKEELNISQLAERCCMSKFHFIREFRGLFSITPYKYLTLCRLFESRQSLLQGNSVRIACYNSGWNSLQHFSSSFKKYFGLSPRSYQRQILSNFS